jgi:phage shock protein A
MAKKKLQHLEEELSKQKISVEHLECELRELHSKLGQHAQLHRQLMGSSGSSGSPG